MLSVRKRVKLQFILGQVRARRQITIYLRGSIGQSVPVGLPITVDVETLMQSEEGSVLKTFYGARTQYVWESGGGFVKTFQVEGSIMRIVISDSSGNVPWQFAVGWYLTE